MESHASQQGAPHGRLATTGKPRRPLLTWSMRGAALLAAATCTGPDASTASRGPRAPSGTPSRALSTGTASFPVTNVGQWAGIIPWPHIAIHMHVLPNGMVLTWPGEEHTGIGHRRAQDAIIWNPATQAQTAYLPNSRTDVFCSGHTFLADGKLFVAGGHVKPFEGVPDVNVFDPARSRWSREAQMNAGRWYPTAITLSNGDVLVAGGTTETKQQNTIAQVWNPRSGWRSLTGAPAAVPFYPWLFQAPDGRVFYAGPSIAQSGFLTVAGSGSWQLTGLPFPQDRFDAGTGEVNGEGAAREYGSAVMLDSMVLRMGGGGFKAGRPTTTITNAVDRIDLSAAGGLPAWRSVAPMSYARRHLNATVLPDGKVLVTGGTSLHGDWTDVAGDENGRVLVPELYDPATNTWTPLEAMAHSRLYHSTAALLPDGRVIVAGSGRPSALNGRDWSDAQILTPPYLLDAQRRALPRPVIGGISATTLGNGQQFTVTVAPAAGSTTTPTIGKVTLVRLSSVTHAWNANQRLNTLQFGQSADNKTLTIVAPANGKVAPPGHYMLFVLDAAGVPSLSTIVQLQTN